MVAPVNKKKSKSSRIGARVGGKIRKASAAVDSLFARPKGDNAPARGGGKKPAAKKPIPATGRDRFGPKKKASATRGEMTAPAKKSNPMAGPARAPVKKAAKKAVSAAKKTVKAAAKTVKAAVKKQKKKVSAKGRVAVSQRARDSQVGGYRGPTRRA